MTQEVGEPGAGPELCFFAYRADRPVALCLCRLTPGGAFVDVLGTEPGSRRRGIASALLNHAMLELAARGARTIGLSVDSANPTGAIRLYEGAGMVVSTSFSVFELKLP
jgi:ribosomal protein S18 acetylase RimI-like enzyme